VTLVVSCSSNNATPTPASVASQPAAVPPASAPAASTAPAIEPVPSLAPENNGTAQTPVKGNSQPTINVKGPTLGANFSGVGDWHINSGPSLTNISVFTQGTKQPVDIAFGFYLSDGAEGVSYAGGQINPSGTYFSLGSDSCAGPVPQSSAGEGGTCANLVFDPSASGGASDPFDATMKLKVRLACKGQDYAACRETPAAQGATPDEPVVLDFTQSVTLHGSTGCDPAPHAKPPCATTSSELSAAPPASPAESAAPANPSTPVQSVPPSAGVQSGPASGPVPSG
jgi:hypothetical protein